MALGWTAGPFAEMPAWLPFQLLLPRQFPQGGEPGPPEGCRSLKMSFQPREGGRNPEPGTSRVALGRHRKPVLTAAPFPDASTESYVPARPPRPALTPRAAVGTSGDTCSHRPRGRPRWSLLMPSGPTRAASPQRVLGGTRKRNVLREWGSGSEAAYFGGGGAS